MLSLVSPCLSSTRFEPSLFVMNSCTNRCARGALWETCPYFSKEWCSLLDCIPSRTTRYFLRFWRWLATAPSSTLPSADPGCVFHLLILELSSNILFYFRVLFGAWAFATWALYGSKSHPGISKDIAFRTCLTSFGVLGVKFVHVRGLSLGFSVSIMSGSRTAIWNIFIDSMSPWCSLCATKECMPEVDRNSQEHITFDENWKETHTLYRIT